MIYFASDPHYGHKNIVAGLSNWSDQSGCRKFPSIKAMNDHIIETFNDTVMETDTLYLLGDIAMGGIQNIIEFRKRLNCKNVIVITGNHDHHFAKPEIRALFTEVVPFKEIIIEGIRVVLCHYPLHVWNESHKGSFHLFGHCIPKQAEILTNNGWKNMDNIEQSDLVYSKSSDSTLTLNPIDSILKYNYSGIVYRGRSKSTHFDFTELHKCIHLTGKGNLVYEDAKDYFKKSVIKIICAGKYSNPGIGWPKSLLELYISLAADGTLANSNLGRLRVLKPRKIAYFKQLLDSLNLVYTELKQKDGSVCLNFQLPIEFKGLKIKGLDKEILLRANREDATIIRDTYAITDGYKYGKGVHIYSSKKEEIDILQHIFVINGYKASFTGRVNHGFSKKESYELRISDYESSVAFNIKERVVPVEISNEDYWCITTLHKNFFMRLNGTVQLTGNCHGSLPEMDWKGNLISDQFFPESKKAKRMDVGIDALYMRSLSYAPYSWDRIKAIMAKRANLVADHHDSTTN